MDLFSPVFAETIYGRKRWFLTAPDVKKGERGSGTKTTLQWLLEDYEKVRSKVHITHFFLL